MRYCLRIRLWRGRRSLLELPNRDPTWPSILSSKEPHCDSFVSSEGYGF